MTRADGVRTYALRRVIGGERPLMLRGCDVATIHAEHTKDGGAVQAMLRSNASSWAMCFHRNVPRNPVPSPWSTVRAQPSFRLDRRSTLSLPISICVFCVFCGSIFL